MPQPKKNLFSTELFFTGRLSFFIYCFLIYEDVQVCMSMMSFMKIVIGNAQLHILRNAQVLLPHRVHVHRIVQPESKLRKNPQVAGLNKLTTSSI